MYEFKPARNYVDYKINNKRLAKYHDKIRLLKNLRAFSGYGNSSFIQIMLKEIELVKQIFVHDVEQGEEVALPFDLNVHNLALSYQFYDPILNIVQ